MRVIADENQVDQLIGKLADQIAHDVEPARSGPAGGASQAKPAPLALVGIRSRGDDLARRLAERLHPDHVGTLDITLYRDDLSEVGPQPVVRTTEIHFPIDGMNIVLVDDVLMTGRSIRAALQSLMDFGRPRRVWLSVLVDRGSRELPIAPDHVALDLSGSAADREGEGQGRGQGAEVGRGGGVLAAGINPGHRVEVQLKPTDPRDAIIVRSQPQRQGAAT